MSQVLASYFAKPASGNLEVRACKAPPNPHRWGFMWAVVEVMPDGATNILAGTGKDGAPGSVTLGDALVAAERAFEQFSLALEVA
jgi:hypothetical protein